MVGIKVKPLLKRSSWALDGLKSLANTITLGDKRGFDPLTPSPTGLMGTVSLNSPASGETLLEPCPLSNVPGLFPFGNQRPEG